MSDRIEPNEEVAGLFEEALELLEEIADTLLEIRDLLADQKEKESRTYVREIKRPARKR